MTKDEWMLACTAQHCQFVHWTYTMEQGTYIGIRSAHRAPLTMPSSPLTTQASPLTMHCDAQNEQYGLYTRDTQ